MYRASIPSPLHLVDVVEEGFVGGVDAEAEVGAFVVAEMAEDVVLETVDAGGEAACIDLTHTGAPRVIPLIVVGIQGAVVLACVILLLLGIDPHKVAEGGLHQFQGQQRSSGAVQRLADFYGVGGDEAGIVRTEQTPECAVIDLT